MNYTIKNGLLMSVADAEKVEIAYQGKRKAQGVLAAEKVAAAAPDKKTLSVSQPK